MLKDVLTAVKCSKVNKIVVVASNQKVKNITKKVGATYLEEKTGNLNASLNKAIEWSSLNGAKSVLILPADIPLVTVKEINEIINLGSKPPFVVVASSHNMGTNALFQNPPTLISPRFGPNSFKKHQKEVTEKGISPIVYQSEGLLLDIDLPEDLDKLLKTEKRTATRKVLAEIRK